MSCITTEEGGDPVPALLPGFGFNPSERALVSYFLKKKIEGKDSEFSHVIPEIDVREHEPSDLPAFFPEPDFPDDFPDDEMEWFFFTRRDYRYKGTHCNRATDQGYYKSTGKVHHIKARRSEAVIGHKRILTFYEGRMPKGKRTNWVIHEYFLTATELDQLGLNPNRQRDFVLCRLKNKSANYKKLKDNSICNISDEPGTGGFVVSNSEDDQSAAANDMILEPEEHLGHKDFRNGNDNHDECTESPNSYCLLDNNDISTCDNDETGDCRFYDFDPQELRALLEENLDSPLPPPQPPQPTHPQPQPQHYFSSNLQSSSYLNLVNVPGVHNDDCSKWESLIGDYNSDHTDNNVSTNDHNEPFSKTDEMILKAYSQPEENPRFFFDPFPLQVLHTDVTNDLGTGRCCAWPINYIGMQ